VKDAAGSFSGKIDARAQLPLGRGCQAATTSLAVVVRSAPALARWRRRRSISATVFAVITTPRQPRLESSSTAQMSDSAEVSPGKRPITADLDEGALEQIGGADPLAMLGGPAQVRDSASRSRSIAGSLAPAQVAIQTGDGLHQGQDPRPDGRRFAGLPLEYAVENVNHAVRGWGNYFRYGNSADKFGEIDGYVRERLAILAASSTGCRAATGVSHFNYEWTTKLASTASAEQ
jgi:Group II intron, maturase-specific domain